MNDTELFFEMFYDRMPAGSLICVWERARKLSRWFPDWQSAVVHVSVQHDRSDNYVGVALADRDLGPYQRVQNATALCLVALAADIDLASVVHKQPALPPDLDSARRLLDDAGIVPTMLVDSGIVPTMLVDSGHGCHAWLKLDPPVVLVDEATRSKVRSISEGWQRHIQQAARQRGWVLDSTFDAARLLRVSGTTNAKSRESPKPVAILEYHANRTYSLADFEAIAMPNSQGLSAHTSYAIRGLRSPGIISRPISRMTA